MLGRSCHGARPRVFTSTVGVTAAAVGLALLAASAGAAHAGRSKIADKLKLKSRVVLVLHNKSGRAMVSRNGAKLHAIASLTKMQVALVVRSRGLKLDRGTVITRADHKIALRGARTRLELRWTYRNRDLLHAALMSSDNRATSALGRAVGLHATALVQALNERARRMGLKYTRFAGPVGINHGNVSTAWEVSRIARATARDGVLRGIMAKRSYVVKPMRGYIRVRYRNTNPLVGKARGVRWLASKTGYNARAGYCIAAVARIRGNDYTFVLLGARTKAARVRELRKLLRWVRRHPRPPSHS